MLKEVIFAIKDLERGYKFMLVENGCIARLSINIYQYDV